MLLIFDCDGVLVDTETHHSEVEATLAREQLGINRNAEEHHAIFSGMGLKNLLKEWEKETGFPLPAGFIQELAQQKEDIFLKKTTAIPHVAEALQSLRAYPHCVATGSTKRTARATLGTAKLYDYFAPHIFTIDDVTLGKPAPDIFLHAAEKMNAHPSECLVIEDSAPGIAAAKAANMQVVGFTGGSHCESGHATKLTGADYIISDMRDLPGLVERHFISAKSSQPTSAPRPPA